MKQLEGLLVYAVLALFAGTAGLAVMWLGLSVFMVVNGAPNSARLAQVATEAEAPVTEAMAEPPAAISATAEAEVGFSVAAGDKVFKKCKACHMAEADGAHKTGPNLWNVIGRPVAAAEGFGYSDAMQAKAGQTWTPESLRAFLAKPKETVPGTSMSFAGLKKDADISNLFLFLDQQSDTPQGAEALGLGGAAIVTAAAEVVAEDEGPVEIDPVPYPEGVTYANPPARSADAETAIAARVAILEALAPTLDYERARFHPIHFPPAIQEASNEECLVCHQEILSHSPREASPAGRPATETLAWYQTLDTYTGAQQSFHYRHLQSDFAKQVMNLECTFCHKGNDPREESPDMLPVRAAFSTPDTPEFNLRKMVNPSETCLRCHGSFPDPEIMGLEGPWHEVRADMEWPEAPNGCMSCHAESFRTVRHGVDYLNAETIETLAREGSSDTCYGCHGGRAWYRISYPYPRHAWPGMDDSEIPEWAITRPTVSDPEYALPASE